MFFTTPKFNQILCFSLFTQYFLSQKTNQKPNAPNLEYKINITQKAKQTKSTPFKLKPNKITPPKPV